MSDAQSIGSEVARLLRQIQEEYESAKLGVSGLAYGTEQHKFITRKMESMGKLHEELHNLVGDASIALVVEQLEAIPDVKSSPVEIQAV